MKVDEQGGWLGAEIRGHPPLPSITYPLPDKGLLPQLLERGGGCFHSLFLPPSALRGPTRIHVRSLLLYRIIVLFYLLRSVLTSHCPLVQAYNTMSPHHQDDMSHSEPGISSYDVYIYTLQPRGQTFAIPERLCIKSSTYRAGGPQGTFSHGTCAARGPRSAPSVLWFRLSILLSHSNTAISFHAGRVVFLFCPLVCPLIIVPPFALSCTKA